MVTTDSNAQAPQEPELDRLLDVLGNTGKHEVKAVVLAIREVRDAIDGLTRATSRQ